MDDKLKDFIFGMKDELIIFHKLTEEEVKHLIPYLEVVLYPKGTILFEEGDSGDFVAFIANGTLEVKKQTEFKGKQIVLGKLGRGSLVGELSFVSDDEPRSASVVAMEDSEVVILKKVALDAVVDKYPVIGIKILKGMIKILAVRLRKSIERLSYVF